MQYKFSPFISESTQPGDNLFKHSRIRNLIRKRRIAKNLTLIELSQSFGYASSHFVLSWEKGEYGPPLYTVPLLCDVLDIPKNEIIQILRDDYEAKLNELFEKAHTPVNLPIFDRSICP